MERTRNFVLLLFAVVLVVSLIVVSLQSSNRSQDLTRSDEMVAKVGSENVTVGELAILKQGRGGTLPVKFLLNPLISQRLIRIEAKKLGLTATDEEVANEIRQIFKTPDGKPFDRNRYEQYAADQAGSVQAFEQSVRDQISGQKLEAFITSGVTVSDEEVLKDYQRKNAKFDLTYVPVSAADLAQTLKPSDEELKNYFEQNKSKYYISQPQKKIRYVFLNTTKIGEKLTISDEDLKAEFEKIPADKKIKGVEGQEIVLRIPKPEEEQQVMQKAGELVAQLKKDGATNVSAEAFATIAKGQSENPATAYNGGKLAGLVRENPNNPNDPYQQLLKMQPGEISEPNAYQGRVYILRRGEAVPKNFEEAKKEIEVSLRNRRAYNAAAELAQKVTENLKQTKDAQKTAVEFAGQANSSVQDMVRETGYIKPGDDIPNIGVSSQFEEGIAGLQNANDVGERIPIQNGFAIPLVVDKKEPRDATFEEVKAKVAEDFKLEQARNKIEEIAKQIAAGANTAGDLTAAAQSKGLKAQDQKSFIIGSPLGQGPSATTSEALEDAIFNLKSGEVTKTPIKAGDNWFVVGVTSRTEASMEDFAKQRDQLIESMQAQKRGQVFSDYLASIRQQMEAKKEIQIYQDALAKLEAASEDEAPTMPQLPQGLQIPQQ
jgi:peptidyl-prolyl cis-trans isomerase D